MGRRGSCEEVLLGGEGMNKYEEAYERLCSKEYHYPDHESVYADIDTLGELAGKEIPKMPLKINRECSMDSIGDCPNCGAFIESFANEFRCSVCGQMLKWEEEE